MFVFWILFMSLPLTFTFGKCPAKYPGSNPCGAIWPLYLHDTSKGKCYTRHDSLKAWEHARVACKTFGGKLAAIKDRSIIRIVFGEAEQLPPCLYGTMLEKPVLDKYWLGAKQGRTGTKFYWLDGSDVEGKLWHAWSYMASLFKNFLQNREKCMALQNDGWEEEDCNERFGYICMHDDLTLRQTPTTTGDVLYTQTSTLKAKDELKSTYPNAITEDVPHTETSQPLKTASKPEPKTVPPTVFANKKIVAGQYNPKLKSKPDLIESVLGKEDCVRVCRDNPSCNLVNFGKPDICAIYSDPIVAEAQGADYAPGWSVWQRQRQG